MGNATEGDGMNLLKENWKVGPGINKLNNCEIVRDVSNLNRVLTTNATEMKKSVEENRKQSYANQINTWWNGHFSWKTCYQHWHKMEQKIWLVPFLIKDFQSVITQFSFKNLEVQKISLQNPLRHAKKRRR